MRPLPSYDDFDMLYERDILPELKKVNTLRKKIFINYSIISIVLFIGFIFESVTWMSIGILFVVVFVFFYTNFFGIPYTKFENAYQLAITLPVMKFICPDFVFDANSYIKLKDLQDGLLISGTPNQYGGENYSELHFNSKLIQVSEIKSYSDEKDENGMSVHHTHFNGLAALIKYDTLIKTRIAIMSDVAFTDDIQSLDQNLILSSTHNHTFTSYYNNEKELNACISPTIWLKLKQYCDITSNAFILCMTPQGVYAGIKRKEKDNYIKPKLTKSVVEASTAKNYYRDVLFATDLLLSISDYTAQSSK